jgi:dienelactone hydrolase
MNRHMMDLYPPEPESEESSESWPIILLQGVEIDKSDYSMLARELCARGRWVVVPNCIPLGRDYLCPNAESVSRVFDDLLGPGEASLQEAMRRGLVLVGHSAGGMAALDMAAAAPLDSGLQVRAVVTYGSNAPMTYESGRSLAPCLILAGNRDSVVTPEISLAAYRRLPASRKIFVELPGFNHYAITNSAAPRHAPTESAAAALSNEASVRVIGELTDSFVACARHGERPDAILQAVESRQGWSGEHVWS